jgi:endonuclease-3
VCDAVRVVSHSGRRQAEYIHKTSKLLLEQHGGDIPSTLDGLLALPGMGPKMSYLVMSSAWDNTVRDPFHPALQP